MLLPVSHQNDSFNVIAKISHKCYFPLYIVWAFLLFLVEINVLTSLTLHHLLACSHEINQLKVAHLLQKRLWAKILPVTEHILEFAVLLFLQIYCAAFTMCTLLEEIDQSYVQSLKLCALIWHDCVVLGEREGTRLCEESNAVNERFTLYMYKNGQIAHADSSQSMLLELCGRKLSRWCNYKVLCVCLFVDSTLYLMALRT